MKEIAKGVFQLALMPRNAINCYVVDDVLIDAGIRGSAPKILEMIKNLKVTKHVLTHAHADHQGSSSLICEKLNIPLFTSVFEKENAESGQVTAEYPDKDHFIARFQQKYWAGKGYKVSGTLKEGDDAGSFRAIETPGHSAGHLSFFREHDGVLIAGDALVNMNLLSTMVGLRLPPALFTTNKEQNIDSVKKIAALKPRIICFGHGPVLVNNGSLNRLIARLK
ncbi:Glyoxylase, beta-lactamase superfamily II [Pedobacter steynii]|uniref:Glyoxylase, beta-lactamase superfamily II n=1 Tax=Pedobacter steynii TaxID=430522 RepID=A0A1G9YBE1_9SPHI|nr:MBL fold metallo-hydrolase [Pedobacter steynii]NQX39647.1 MBL fold metallo-hydrolase [Pedobacter steynii]SDN05723.1 Glyoxylase, beta-lactamase superfamily II [Pedobacter steynii]